MVANFDHIRRRKVCDYIKTFNIKQSLKEGKLYVLNFNSFKEASPLERGEGCVASLGTINTAQPLTHLAKHLQYLILQHELTAKIRRAIP
jgi:hypothetical protein